MILSINQFKIGFIILLFLIFPYLSNAATLSISPNTGVYTAGKTFTVKLVVNTEGKSINAAEGSLKFNPQELSVVAIDKSSSIFNLWVAEPTFSNSAGTISFSGGLPTGYTGSVGNIFNITFRTTSASNGKLSFVNGSVLANDGMGTNILSGMNGGNFTIQAPSNDPKAEVVVEYVAPANTPAAPKIESNTHKSGEWSNNNDAYLKWGIASGVTSVRTSLDSSPTNIPVKIYDNPISEIKLDDLSEGTSYFHLQFKNADGWGKISHFALKIDSEKPDSFEIKSIDNPDYSNPIQTLKLEAKDKTSEVKKYKIKIDDQEPYEYIDEKKTNEVVLPSLLPGYHTVVIEAFDEAGNSIIATHSFTILSFDKPVFTEYPDEIGENVIPVIIGNTRPNSKVEILVNKIGTEPNTYEINSNDKGVFTFIPEGRFSTGVYELSARATDQFGAKSELSETIRIAVQEPGYVRIGGFLIDLLSVVIPLIALVALTIFACWFALLKLRSIRKRVSKESGEAMFMAQSEFSNIQNIIKKHEQNIILSRKNNKLTKSESELINELNDVINTAKSRVEKEISDVEQVIQKRL